MLILLVGKKLFSIYKVDECVHTILIQTCVDYSMHTQMKSAIDLSYISRKQSAWFDYGPTYLALRPMKEDGYRLEISDLSRHFRKPTIFICKNKDADQLCS